MNKELLTMLVSNIEVIGQRLDLIQDQIDLLTKKVPSSTADDIRLLKCVVLEIQETISTAPASRFTYHALTCFNNPEVVVE